MSLEMPILHTGRLIIRPFRLNDLGAVRQAMDGAEWGGSLSLPARRAWLEWTVRNYTALAELYQPPYGERAIVLKATQEVIGAVGLVPSLMPFGLLPYYRERINPAQAALSFPEVGLYWALAQEFRGQGYATEAAQALVDYGFGGLRLARMVATTEYTNLASQGVMQRLGMRLEQNPFPQPEYMQVVGILENPGG